MIVLMSIGGSEPIELICIHRDKGKNVDPEERGNGMEKHESGPSWINFDNHRAIDCDHLETNEDGDLTTVVLADKGNGIDPQEYGGALYDPKSMMAPAGTTSTGGLDSIELVGIHGDKEKDVDPEERGNEMVKYEPGPSWINFHDHPDLAKFFQEQVILLQFFE